MKIEIKHDGAECDHHCAGYCADDGSAWCNFRVADDGEAFTLWPGPSCPGPGVYILVPEGTMRILRAEVIPQALENAAGLAKFEGQEMEARAREWAARYVREAMDCVPLDKELGLVAVNAEELKALRELAEAALVLDDAFDKYTLALEIEPNPHEAELEAAEERNDKALDTLRALKGGGK